MNSFKEQQNEKDKVGKVLEEKNESDGEEDSTEGVDETRKRCVTPGMKNDELETVFVEEIEETIPAKEKDHICVDKENKGLSTYICGSCQTKFNTICKLHDHFSKKHLAGTYIYFQSSRIGFPRLENVSKFTQTDLDDLLETDQAQFKGDEANDTDEYDLESEHVKIDGTVSDNEINLKNRRTSKTRGKKRKKVKHTKETEKFTLKGLDETAKSKLYISNVDHTKRKAKKRKTQEKGSYQSSSEEVGISNSLELNEEDDSNVRMYTENLVNKSDQSQTDLTESCERKVAQDNTFVKKDTLKTTAEFTTFKESLKKPENVLPRKKKQKETRISKTQTSKVMTSESKNSGKYSCSICATKYMSKVRLQYHIARVHKKVNTADQKQCRWCNAYFPSSKSSAAHARQCEKNENLFCLICDQKFSSRQEVTNHLVTHRDDDELKCKVCQKIFTCEVFLQGHLRQHNLLKKLQCEQCGRSFYYHNLLTKHKMYCNREPDIACPLCPNKFKAPHNLKQHMAVHSNERPFVCHICGYAAKKSMYLKRHLRVHTGEKPYICSECGISFAGANGLNRHKKTHTNDKPCTCNFCGKSFTNNWNLKTHIRQHTGDSPYQCTLCGKAFKQNVLLKLHSKTHLPAESILL